MSVLVTPGVGGGSLQGAKRSSGRTDWFVPSLVAAAVIAAASVMVSFAIGFDPSGWVVYGREWFGRGALDTSSNPAWKPLPILLDGICSLFTHGRADAYFWLLCARTMGIFLVFGVGLLAARYAGRWAGLAAALLLLVSPWWLANTMLGQDGPVTAGLAVAGILAYQRGWVRTAGVAAVCASLVRPEAAVFTLVFGLWAWRRRQFRLWELFLGAAVIVVLWAWPSFAHAGYSPGTIASRGGIPGTPIRAAVPFLAEFGQSASQMFSIPSGLVIVGLVAMLLGLRGHPRPAWLTRLWGVTPEERAVFAAAFVWLLIIALETLGGFSGNVRYTIPAYALFSIVAAVVAIRILRQVPIAGSLALAATAVITGITALGPLRAQHRLVVTRQNEMPQIRAEIKRLSCPRYNVALAVNSTYVALEAHQSVPEKHHRVPLAQRSCAQLDTHRVLRAGQMAPAPLTDRGAQVERCAHAVAERSRGPHSHGRDRR